MIIGKLPCIEAYKLHTTLVVLTSDHVCYFGLITAVKILILERPLEGMAGKSGQMSGGGGLHTLGTNLDTFAAVSNLVYIQGVCLSSKSPVTKDIHYQNIPLARNSIFVYLLYKCRNFFHKLHGELKKKAIPRKLQKLDCRN